MNDAAAQEQKNSTAIVPGMFCWWDLATSDWEGATAFYKGIFGWSPNDTPMGPDQYYRMLEVDGKQAGALYQMSPEQQQQMPPAWTSYVMVENLEETIKKAEGAGGTVIMPPMDVMGHGRMALLQDPTGGIFAIWQTITHGGAQHANDLNGVVWNELATKDAKVAGEFYAKTFGWKLNEMPMEGMTYTTFQLPGSETYAGGMMQMTAEWGEIPTHWMPYFGVADCDASAAKARDLGGAVITGPMDIPGVGRFAVLRDPQGAHFSILQGAQ